MTQDATGWIIVRIANKGKKNEIVFPMKVWSTLKKDFRCIEAQNVLETTLYTAESVAVNALAACKLGRPESNLELRQAVVKLEVLT